MRCLNTWGLGFIAPLALVACEAPTDHYLYRQGASVSQADSDYFECKLSAARAVPTDARVGTTPTYTTPVQTNCYTVGYSVQCNTTGGQTYGGQTYTYDANKKLRNSYLARCLASRGYSATELPVCDTKKLSQTTLAKLHGKLRQPSKDACYVQVTENAGNVVYASELGGS